MVRWTHLPKDFVWWQSAFRSCSLASFTPRAPRAAAQRLLIWVPGWTFTKVSTGTCLKFSPKTGNSRLKATVWPKGRRLSNRSIPETKNTGSPAFNSLTRLAELEAHRPRWEFQSQAWKSSTPGSCATAPSKVSDKMKPPGISFRSSSRCVELRRVQSTKRCLFWGASAHSLARAVPSSAKRSRIPTSIHSKAARSGSSLWSWTHNTRAQRTKCSFWLRHLPAPENRFSVQPAPWHGFSTALARSLLIRPFSSHSAGLQGGKPAKLPERSRKLILSSSLFKLRYFWANSPQSCATPPFASWVLASSFGVSPSRSCSTFSNRCSSSKSFWWSSGDFKLFKRWAEAEARQKITKLHRCIYMKRIWNATCFFLWAQDDTKFRSTRAPKNLTAQMGHCYQLVPRSTPHLARDAHRFCRRT